MVRGPCIQRHYLHSRKWFKVKKPRCKFQLNQGSLHRPSFNLKPYVIVKMHFKSHHKIETDLVSFPSWFLWEGGKDGKCWRAFTMGSEEYLTEAFGEFIKPDHVDTKDHKVYGSKF